MSVNSYYTNGYFAYILIMYARANILFIKKQQACYPKTTGLYVYLLVSTFNRIIYSTRFLTHT